MQNDELEAVVTKAVELLIHAGFITRDLYDELVHLEVDTLDLNLQVCSQLQYPVTVH